MISGANIGFVGIGNMGARMAMNILRKRPEGGKLFIYDKFSNTPSFKELVSMGATSAESAGKLAEECSIVISMLPASPHVHELYMSNILPSLTKQSLLIDCSTIDPGTTRLLHAAAAKSGHVMIDAPVSGGIKGAQDGTLTFMIGTSLPESRFDSDVKDLFAPMGRPIYCGGPGVGQSVKICNNLILGAQMLGVAEGFALADRLGVDLKKFHEIVNSSTGQCWTSSKYNPVPGLMENVPASRHYNGGFMTDLMMKDLGLAVDAAKGCGCSVPVTEFSRTQYKRASDMGFGSFDFGCVFKMFKQGFS
jgi:3-hydroxyisobutyrate dehydrogenase